MDITAEAWAALSPALDEALDLGPEELHGWFERLEKENPQLVSDARAFLAERALAEACGFLSSIPAPPIAGKAWYGGASSSAGDQVGPYRLIREVGAGGMAHVWLAERADGAFSREVALKLPQFPYFRSDLAERFERERDILAKLEHPLIARLYDAGVTANGMPYLAMEFVDGEPITRYCDSKRLDLVGRLALFAQVLQAVQYAHAHLVIHRDLKPSNILVAADGQVRLLDFGIAKLLAADDAVQETRLTRLGGRALTPQYASPEQIKGEPLTIATDIYSLGVVLHELLTGGLPYQLKLASAAQLEVAIVEAQPGTPSASIDGESAAQARGVSQRKLARALAGDLDTIILKALKKTTSERYESIASFADDLERHRQGNPVRARPDSLLYRAERFVMRHKLETVIVAVVVLAFVGGAYAQAAVAIALAAGSAVALWQARIARRQAGAARRERAQAITAAEKAKKAESVAQAVQRFMSDLFRANALAQDDPAAMRQMTAHQLLDRGANILEGSMRDAPEARVALWSLFGRLYDDLDLVGQSAQVRGRAVAEAREVFGADSVEVGNALVQYADAVHRQWPDQELALRLLGEARAILSRRTRHSSAFADLLLIESSWIRDKEPVRAVENCFEAVRLRRELGVDDRALAEALMYLGWTSAALGRYEQAERALVEAREMYLKLHGARGAVLAIVWRGLGEAWAGQFRHAEAVGALTTAIEIQLATHTPNETHSPDGRFMLARSLLALGRLSEAEKERAAIEAFPCPPGAKVVAAMNRVRSALLKVQQGDERAACDSIESLAAIVAHAPGGAIAGWVAVARFHLHDGDVPSAHKVVDEAEKIAAKYGAPVWRLVELAATKAEVHAREGQPHTALRELDEVQRKFRIDSTPCDLTLELDMARARAFGVAGNWAAACSLLQPWLDFQSMIGSKLPLRAERELCLLAHDALRAQGIEANALLERAGVAFKPGEVERAREGR